MTSVNPETGSPDTYEYDSNGNMTCRIENGVTYSQAYNAENRISSIAKRTGDCATGTILESWSFAYDGDGVRVSTAHFTGASGTPDSTTSYFMGGQFEIKDGATKKYYSIAGMMVAMNNGTGLQYLLTDHLGSTVAVTNSSGTLTSQQRYLPFGAPRTIPNSPILGTDFTYTGQRKLDDGMGGVMDYRARFYSPYLNHFTQPDTLIPGVVNPQAWNRFSYVLNNPVRFNDPTGHYCVGDDEDCADGGGGTAPPKPSCYPGELVCQLEEGKYKPKPKDEIWEDLADSLLPARESGSKLTGTLNGAFFAGWQWSRSLITTKDGQAQWYRETGFGGQLINIGWSLTQGEVKGLSTAADYRGKATEFFVNAGLTTFVWWEANDKSTSGFDTGGSIGLMPLEIGTAQTNAEPVGASFDITGSKLFLCRLVSLCGR